MNKEMQILDLIKQNPYLSQQEIASQVGLSRPAVANYIKKLTDSGEIIGRAYILNEKSSVTCIGGANIDRKAHANQKVRLGSSNPVLTEEALGGVARNVAENISRLGLATTLITFIGQDREGQWIIDSSQQLGMNVSQSVTIPNERTGTYTALIDSNGEMVVSMADMDIYDQVTVEMLEKRWPIIAGSKAVFVDTNITKESLAWLIQKCAQSKVKLFLDPVSSAKAEKLPSDLTGIHTIMPNREEAELLSGVELRSEGDYEKAGQALQQRGVENIIITLGGEGIFYKTKDDAGTLIPFETEVKDVTGAGDAFAASLMYGIVQGEDFRTACTLGLAAASLTLQSPQSVSTEMNIDRLNKIIKERSS